MNARLAYLLTRVYPRRWRERYGVEFEALLRAGSGGIGTCADVLCSALRERILPTRGKTMELHPITARGMLKQPSAFLPLAMSLVALTLVLVHVAVYGAVREASEGPTAHLWQLLMAAQIPVIAFFVIKWLPRARRPTLGVLAQQAGAALASLAAVFFFNLG